MYKICNGVVDINCALWMKEKVLFRKYRFVMCLEMKEWRKKKNYLFGSDIKAKSTYVEWKCEYDIIFCRDIYIKYTQNIILLKVRMGEFG